MPAAPAPFFAAPDVPAGSIPGFDPRRVPVSGTDAHLPAVPFERCTPEALRLRFRTPPAWQPDVRREPSAGTRAPAAASVLLGIVQRPEPTVLLTERTAHLSTHSGQVAFPGGRADPGDADAADTALREAQEEVGLERRWVQVLGQLPTYATITAFVVTPVVALIQPGCVLRANPDEVADVFEVPLAFLMDPAHHRRHVVEGGEGRREWFSMPWTDPATGKEYFVWGATAGMLRNFYRFLAA
ncbi:CoA pyrophosphatase [Xylophilus ampelinus]|uniref:CoA pyrophosphatase n=1 Tax=Xylophilus ampelinus TaxID=54067 RepID=UPI001F1BA8BA|nr:CoA pyrophosphatase [Xylophilus ampelinus]MCS4511460.1 CoA pyrophosphatase [Xylophilus ampelinus]